MEAEVRRLVVGLGNPGPEYEDTRHNVGFRIVEAFVARERLPAFHRKGGGLESQGSFGGSRLAVLKPLLYMNRSG
ncbi:MAG: aminoacyl-tRNA hydrolase, partial [Gemmatimonadetes bacterium]|nr:aminoacyl-tRNA hydrolase [Gemmatimonadota bacterium]